jgi:hypothetical protein
MAKRRSRATKSGRPIRNKRRWALLVYIAGDNDLSDAGLKDIKEMCKAGSSSKLHAGLHVGVEIDTYGEHTGSIRYEITEPDYEGVAHRTVIDRLSEKDTGDPKVLKDFLKWGLKRYPAKYRLLVVGGHGVGFRSPVRDIAYDDFGSSLNMPEMERALKRAGITSENPLQILGFDACLMSMVEIAHHFASQTEIIVGSQHTEPGDGWPYKEVLNQAKNAQTPDALAKGIVKDYIKDYKKRGIRNVTQSAVRTGKTQAVIDALNILGNELSSNFEDIEDDLHFVRIETQTFYMADYIDLIHFSSQLLRKINDSSITEAAKKVVDSAKASIITNKKYGSMVANANGLSVWFPPTKRIYYKNRAKYMELHCNDSNQFGWKTFLDRYHQ